MQIVTAYKSGALLAIALSCSLFCDSASATSIKEAIRIALHSNPSLNSERYKQVISLENNKQAWRQLLPTLNLNVTSGRSKLPLSNYGFEVGSGTYDISSTNATLNFNQPIYSGGAIVAGIAGSEANLNAGKATLRNAEISLIYAVIEAYISIHKTEKLLKIRSSNIENLITQVENAKLRKKIGQATSTDVSLVEAQLANAKSQKAATEAQLINNHAKYVMLVGEDIENLEDDFPGVGIPNSLEEAFAAARNVSPNLIEAQYSEQASFASIDQAKASYFPKVSLQITTGRTYGMPINSLPYDQSSSAQIVISQSIFEKGQSISKVTQAKAQNQSDKLNIEYQARVLLQKITQSWAKVNFNKVRIESTKNQVESAKVAYSGMEAQYKLGLCSMIDLLNSQEKLKEAEAASIEAEHEIYLSKFELIRDIGQLEANF